MSNTENNMDKKETITDLAIQQDINLGLDIVNRREEAFAFFKDLLKGRGNGVTSPNEAMLVYGRCRELALPFMATLDHMCVIQGKVCADIHIKSALALRAGHSLYWKQTKDYEPHYKYSDGTNEWISNLKPLKFVEEVGKEDPVVATLQYVWGASSKDAAISAGKSPFYNINGHNVAFDYITEYVGYRVRTLKNGKEETIEAKGSFSSLAGHLAQLGFGKNNGDYAGVRDPNSNWGKYEKRMVDVRAFDNLLKVIAADLTMGMPEISEMAEAFNMTYNVNASNGNAQLVSNTNIEDAKVIDEGVKDQKE